jgi:hypothetical protein
LLTAQDGVFIRLLFNHHPNSAMKAAQEIIEIHFPTANSFGMYSTRNK